MRDEDRPPLTKIPGEDNSADLMTKHLSINMILRHMLKFNLAHVGGRSEAAAKFHALGEAPRTTARPLIPRSFSPTIFWFQNRSDLRNFDY